MPKKVYYDEDARKRVLAGAEVLYNAVKTTMGPKGRNVVISKGFGGPTVTHDGVTVAKGVELDDSKEENYGQKEGAELIKEAASKMNDVAGDGTTSVTVLTYHILTEANKLIAAGHNPMQLRKELEAASKDILTKLQADSEDITDNVSRITEVATISAGDAEIGKLISDVVSKVGKDGVVTVEEGQGLQLESELVEGFTFDKGFLSPYMVTDTTRMEAVYEKPAIIVTDAQINSIKDLLPLIEKLLQSGKKNVLLVASGVEGEALGALILNKLKGVLNVVAVRAPSYGDRRGDVLEDIATLTGATVISEQSGLSLETADLSVVGTARKVIVDKDETTVIEGGGDAKDISERIDMLDEQAIEASSEFDKEYYQKRGAALAGKVSVIKVGGATETEINEKKFRVDDAVAASKAALAEGIVPGGGVTLVSLAQTITDTTAGASLLKTALYQPFRTLLRNSGLNPDEWLPKVLASNKFGYGIDVSVDNPTELADLKAAGIIDPTRVTREVIQNALSVAGTMITMGALVVEIPQDKPDPMAQQPMM